MPRLCTNRTWFTIHIPSDKRQSMGTNNFCISGVQFSNIAEFVKNQLKIQHDRFNEQALQNLQLDLIQQSALLVLKSSKIID